MPIPLFFATVVEVHGVFYAFVGFEGLVRWNRPGYGIVSPADFLSVAEETGMIIPLGERVLVAT